MASFNDSINIIKHLTVKRITNLFILKTSYIWSKWTKQSIHSGMPFSLSIEPTTACNLGCPECPSGLKQFTRPTGKLDLDLHKSMIEQVKKSVFYINYYFQGEPFIHPQFLDLIEEAKKNKIYTATSTNAHFITKEMAKKIIDSGLDRLIISIDGLTQETYENYRVNGELNKVIQGTEFLLNAKNEKKSNTPHLIFQFLAVKPNEHEIDDIFKLGAKMGIDEVRIKSAQLYDYKNGNPLMPENEKYSRYKLKKDGTYKLKYKTGDHCWRMWSSSVFTWDGKVVPCCFDKDAKHILGTLEATTFKSIWRSKQYSSFRQAVLTNRNSIDICQNCSEGAKVWV
ncbi:MAG: SPASM domain-containing protein [Flavobacteriales bacterium]|nr:SPASM domain-containing protein [Flavobacteriales bacterium]